MAVIVQTVVLQEDTNVLLEHAASIFRGEMNRVKMQLCYGADFKEGTVVFLTFPVQHSYWLRPGSVSFPPPMDLIDDFPYSMTTQPNCVLILFSSVLKIFLQNPGMHLQDCSVNPQDHNMKKINKFQHSEFLYLKTLSKYSICKAHYTG